jgi:hypothetical protein
MLPRGKLKAINETDQVPLERSFLCLLLVWVYFQRSLEALRSKSRWIRWRQNRPTGNHLRWKQYVLFYCGIATVQHFLRFRQVRMKDSLVSSTSVSWALNTAERASEELAEQGARQDGP